MTAAELSAAYAAGALSPVDIVAAALKRIAQWEPHIHAMYRVHGDDAQLAARASEARWGRGQPLSPLDGVPVTIKDNIATAGDPSPLGTRANEAEPPAAADGPPAARVREAGCVILGKTTMPDYGMLSSGLSSLHGVTRNPWRLDRNPSGSSSGAAAACAAGYAPLHLGTDIGGSVRLPATHCGLVALKPSLGRVPLYPPFMGRVVGPMTRTVMDAALLMNVLVAPDSRDYMNLPPQRMDYAAHVAAAEPQLHGVRIGLLAEAGAGLNPQPEVSAALDAAAQALAKAGADVRPLRPMLTPAMLDGWCRFFEARLHCDFVALIPERQRKVLPFVAEWCSYRAESFSGRDVMAAYNGIQILRETVLTACQPFDYVISPTSPILPYEADLPAPGNDPRNALPHIAFTVGYNMSEQPAASVNWCASADGLPVGVQIAGRRFDDAGVLRMARVMELLRPAQRGWPEPA